ncbi:hypothetical protein ACOMHN_014351 [Nucella lapillus]
MLCSCPCSAPRRKLTPEQQEVMTKMIKSLAIDRKNTTSRKRKLTCAPDQRTSVQVIGWLGMVVFGLLFGVIVAMDISSVCCRKHKRAGDKQNQVRKKAVKND